MAVLDTSAIIELIRGSPIGNIIRERYGGSITATTAICYNEVFIGVKEKDRPLIEDLFHELDVLPFDQHAARKSIEIEKSLKEAGRPTEKLDLFIASICIAHNLPLITTDKGFLSVEGLEVLGVWH